MKKNNGEDVLSKKIAPKKIISTKSLNDLDISDNNSFNSDDFDDSADLSSIEKIINTLSERVEKDKPEQDKDFYDAVSRKSYDLVTDSSKNTSSSRTSFAGSIESLSSIDFIDQFTNQNYNTTGVSKPSIDDDWEFKKLKYNKVENKRNNNKIEESVTCAIIKSRSGKFVGKVWKDKDGLKGIDVNKADLKNRDLALKFKIDGTNQYLQIQVKRGKLKLKLVEKGKKQKTLKIDNIVSSNITTQKNSLQLNSNDKSRAQLILNSNKRVNLPFEYKTLKDLIDISQKQKSNKTISLDEICNALNATTIDLDQNTGLDFSDLTIAGKTNVDSVIANQTKSKIKDQDMSLNEKFQNYFGSVKSKNSLYKEKNKEKINYFKQRLANLSFLKYDLSSSEADLLGNDNFLLSSKKPTENTKSFVEKLSKSREKSRTKSIDLSSF